MNHYLFYGIKDWNLGKVIHISDEFAATIDRDIHRDPNEEGSEYEADFGERQSSLLMKKHPAAIVCGRV